MSKRKYRSENTVNELIEDENPVEEQVEPIGDENPVEEMDSELVEPKNEEDESVSTKVLLGVVTNCRRLNVREEPNKDSNILTTIDSGKSVTIYSDESTDGWYRVSIEDNVKGYCMKEYISIQ